MHSQALCFARHLKAFICIGHELVYPLLCKIFWIATMDGHIDTTPEPTSPPQIRSRIPLIPKRNTSTAVTKQIRRKGSFIRRVDSSEESPSPHGSIFEAYYHSTTNSDESGQVDPRLVRSLAITSLAPPPQDGRENNENSRIGQIVTANTSNTSDGQFFYGRGTALETIVERNSHGSIKILARAQSVDNLRSAPLLDHQDSFVLDRSPRRKKSASLDNLNSIIDSYHQAVAMIERTTHKPLPIHEIYAQPKAPIQEPLQRPETPPGMPSWTEHQLCPSQQSSAGATNRLQRFFRLQSLRPSLSSDVPPPEARNRAVSAPAGGRRPRTARYRPPKSVYGRIDQHPFNNAPTAIVDPFPPQLIPASPTGKRKSVRFTPSATARDSEPASSQTAAEPLYASASQSLAQTEPSTPNNSALPQPKTPEKQRQCPHRKRERTALKQLQISNTSTPGIEYQAILSHPLTCQDSSLSLPHILTPSPAHPSSPCSQREDLHWDLGIIDISGTHSNSSTAHLMSGALLAPSPSPTHETQASHQDTSILAASSDTNQCWRCRLRVIVDKVEKLWGRGANYLCLICCGFDADEDGSILAPRHARSELGGNGEGYHEMTGRARTIRGWWDHMESPLGPARRVNVESPRAA